MAEKPDATMLRGDVTGQLDADERTLKALFCVPPSSDVIFRRLTTRGFKALLVYIEGMAADVAVNQFVLSPLMEDAEAISCPPEGRARALVEGVVAIDDVKFAECFEEIVTAILAGKSVLLCEDCREAALFETRGYERRHVNKTVNESVIMGAQEGFVENMRTNVTLLRRLVRSELLVAESMTIGTALPAAVSLVYLKGVARPELVERFRRRLKSLNVPKCQGAGNVMQLIEDNPYALFPQMLMTERPDRAASFLADGQIVAVVDGSPYVLVAPVTFFHILHTSDDTFMRWQYGTFMRVVRMVGVVLSVFLPGFYIALVNYHSHMIPINLLSAIAESRVKVPFNVLTEVFIMEVSLYMINEAGSRVPSQMGAALSIVGALILGQAAVAASVISPILIIIIALTAIGNFVVPLYAAGFALQILRLMVVLAGAAFGLFGVTLAAAFIACHMAGMSSLGEPYLAPVTPYRPHNPDILLRLPLWLQRTRLFLSLGRNWAAGKPGPERGWKEGEGGD